MWIHGGDFKESSTQSRHAIVADKKRYSVILLTASSMLFFSRAHRTREYLPLLADIRVPRAGICSGPNSVTRSVLNPKLPWVKAEVHC